MILRKNKKDEPLIISDEGAQIDKNPENKIIVPICVFVILTLIWHAILAYMHM